MKFAIFALLAQASAQSWDTSALCDEAMPVVTSTSKSSADACSSYCAAVDSQTQTLGKMCCSYVGTTCTLYDAGATTGSNGSGSSYVFDHAESMADDTPSGVMAVSLAEFVQGVKAHLASAGCPDSCINAILSSPIDKTEQIGS